MDLGFQLPFDHGIRAWIWFRQHVPAILGRQVGCSISAVRAVLIDKTGVCSALLWAASGDVLRPREHSITSFIILTLYSGLENVPPIARGLCSGILQQGYACGYLLAAGMCRPLFRTYSLS